MQQKLQESKEELLKTNQSYSGVETVTTLGLSCENFGWSMPHPRENRTVWESQCNMLDTVDIPDSKWMPFWIHSGMQNPSGIYKYVDVKTFHMSWQQITSNTFEIVWNKILWYLFQEARQVVVNNTSETHYQTRKSSSPSSEHSVLKPLRVPSSPVLLFMLFPCITSWADWATKFFLTFPSYYHTGCLIGIIILAYYNPHITG